MNAGNGKIGIKDVAEAAGVSITTVSHALSGKGRLPEATRERVRAVAQQLGYTPDPAARSLASGRTRLIAAVVSVPGDTPIAFTEIDYYAKLMNAATRVCLERGYSLVLTPSPAGAETWSRLPLDGVIVIDPADTDPVPAHLRSRGLPMVFVGRDPNGEPDDLVVQNDRRAGTRSVLDHLVEAGAHRVGILTLRTYESFTAECLEAYGRWCAERGMTPSVLVGQEDSTGGQAAFRAVAERFMDLEDRPDAVFCLYERVAVELLAVARAREVRVPEDLLVVTISEVGLSEATHPPLTTLDLDQDSLGARATDVLIAALEGKEARSELRLPTRLTPRASTMR